MSGAVVIRRCASAEEATVVCALLNDADIEAWLDNWYHAANDWLISLALGGVGVLVPEAQKVEAERALAEHLDTGEHRLGEEFPDMDRRPLKKSRLRAWTFVSLYNTWGLILLSIPFIAGGILIGSIAESAGEGLNVEKISASFAAYDWTRMLTWAAATFALFLVLLGIFVFLARRFLNQRARQKHPA